MIKVREAAQIVAEVDEIERVDHNERLYGLELVKDIPPERKAQTREALRTVRRLEELELAAPAGTKTAPRVSCPGRKEYFRRL